jgi:predicted membrane protein DUF2306
MAAASIVMTDLTQGTEDRGLRPAAVVALALIASLLVVPTALIAIVQGLGLVQLPYELFLVGQRRPIAFPLHMVASGLALILIPIAAFARRKRGVHRAAGRMAAICVAVGGVTALFVALASEATPVARAGFFVQGLVWLALLATALAAIRRGDVARHHEFVIAMAAVAFGAIVLRLVMAGAAAIDLPYDMAYGVAAWGCWVGPLGAAAIWINRRRAAAARPPSGHRR